jgi:hypothetical protein
MQGASLGGLLALRLGVAELALRVLRAEHRQVISDVAVGAPLVRRVLVVTRLTAALGVVQL